MIKNLQIELEPDVFRDEKALYARAATALRVPVSDITQVRIRKLSLDARPRIPRYTVMAEVYVHPDVYVPGQFRFSISSVPLDALRVIVAGMGPAGLFASLTLAAAGIRPVVLERGKPVRERKRDVALLGRNGQLDTESNYSFGEGGAGCFSDGKLYTRSNKRGDIGRVLRTFVHYGAREEILYQSHPHLGSDRMPAIVEKMRQALIEAGAEIHFHTRIDSIQADAQGRFAAVTDQKGNEYRGEALILATGNSAGELYRWMAGNRLRVEEKPFAMGVRLEHPQAVIDDMQYKGAEKRYALPPAEYGFAVQSGGKGVFSFCMCPGGVVVPAATCPDGLVVNGMSDSGRNSPWANAGWVVSVDRPILERYGYHPSPGPLALLDFQQQTERTFLHPGRGFSAPAQRLTDFMAGRESRNLPATSYTPGIFPADMDRLLPGFIADALRDAFGQVSGKKNPFLTDQAILLGLESRTSSPVRIPRDPESFQHPDMPGLYPCGEGAGYAGGITSSAIDGMNCAGKILVQKNRKDRFGLLEAEEH